jgi:hypothetical protein
MMAGGISPIAEASEPVFATEVFNLVENAREKWKHPDPIPRWCCDGLHSAGDDERFMGVWFHMYAACVAFEHYGRLNPTDEWLPEFLCYDGLTISTDLASITTENSLPHATATACANCNKLPILLHNRNSSTTN